MKLKTIAFALSLALASSVSALDIDHSTGGQFYVSSYSNAAMYYNMNAGESINIYAHGSSNLFCGVSAYSTPGNLITAGSTGLIPTRFTAKYKSLYLVVCIKSSGPSANNILVLENINKRSAVENTIDYSDSALLEQLKHEMAQ